MTDQRRDDDPRRLGPLAPSTEADDVVVHNPPDAPMVMSADEADLSAIRLLDAAAEARKKEPKS